MRAEYANVSPDRAEVLRKREDRHRARMREHMKKKVRARRAAGRCGACGLVKSKKWRCSTCREMHNAPRRRQSA